jgi:4-amino-4-deoxy-L-arabinose transferase-like glycosyltransferase
MSENWHNFLYNSFDPGGFLSLDKPPVAIWLQVAGAKLLGFSGMSILLPQVLAGLVSILLLYLLVQRSFGSAAAVWAALVLALTPVSVAVDRSNNTDSCLITVLLVAAALAIRAAQTRRPAWLCAAMAAVGIGFNVKMGAAFVLAPVIALTFGLASRTAPLIWHLRQQAIAGMVLIVVSLSWIVFFDLTPAANRPYAGSTKHNSMLELACCTMGPPAFCVHPHRLTMPEVPA